MRSSVIVSYLVMGPSSDNLDLRLEPSNQILRLPKSNEGLERQYSEENGFTSISSFQIKLLITSSLTNATSAGVLVVAG